MERTTLGELLLIEHSASLLETARRYKCEKSVMLEQNGKIFGI